MDKFPENKNMNENLSDGQQNVEKTETFEKPEDKNVNCAENTSQTNNSANGGFPYGGIPQNFGEQHHQAPDQQYGQNQQFGQNMQYSQNQQYGQGPYFDQSQQPFGTPYVQPKNTQGTGLSIAGFVLSLVSFVSCCSTQAIVIFSTLITGLVLSIIGMVSSRKGGKINGLGIAGMVISIVHLLFWIVMIAFIAIVGVEFFYEFANQYQQYGTYM